MKKIQLYVLKESMKFDKKFYGMWGFKFWRPIPVRSFFYFLTPFALMVSFNFIPFVKNFLSINVVKYGALYIIIPTAITYFLTDVGTENRSPIKFLRSVILYGFRKMKGVSYYRGKELPRLKNYKFHSIMLGGYLTYREPRKDDEND